MLDAPDAFGKRWMTYESEKMASKPGCVLISKVCCGAPEASQNVADSCITKADIQRSFWGFFLLSVMEVTLCV